MTANGVSIQTCPLSARVHTRPLSVCEPHPGQLYYVFKRTLDVFLATTLLFFFTPLITLITLLIKCLYPGPAIFKQTRTGFHGQEFTMYKLRSMVSNAEQLQAELAVFNIMRGPVFKVKNDPRVTRFGKFLRRTSLDELPQLWNVLQGHMSVVGPRPPLPSEVAQYSEKEKERLTVKPGLTCLWQINGRSKIVEFNQWLQLDLDYIHNRSVWLDLRILLETIPAVLTGLGAE